MWLPDNLFLLQEYLPHDPEQGIVRLEFLGGELLYAMRVKTHGRFNLCPSPVCNPGRGRGACEIPAAQESAPPVEFYPYPRCRERRWQTAARIVRAAGLDVGGIEYLETPDGRRVFYDINANSNLRPSVAAAFGFDPFERVVTFLEKEIRRSERERRLISSDMTATCVGLANSSTRLRQLVRESRPVKFRPFFRMGPTASNPAASRMQLARALLIRSMATQTVADRPFPDLDVLDSDTRRVARPTRSIAVEALEGSAKIRAPLPAAYSSLLLLCAPFWIGRRIGCCW